MRPLLARPPAIKPAVPEEERAVPRPMMEPIIGKLDSLLKEVVELRQEIRALRKVEDAELDILRHTRTIPEDYDASDGVLYDLDDGYAATITLEIPTNHIFLFKEFFSSDVVGTTYATYIDGRLYVTVPDLEFPVELGIPVEKEVKIVVTNASGVTQTYVTYIRGVFRPKALWKRPVRRAW